MPATFTFHCPKCSSTSLSRIDGGSTFFKKPDIILGCKTCGTRLYGEAAIEAEYIKQKIAWREAHWKMQAEFQLQEGGPGEKVADPIAPEICAWHECDEPSRSNSKYCSRNCSNKNARSRYQARKKASAA